MKKQLITSLLFVFMSGATLEAAPALPVKHRLTQPDGTMITVYLRGDEFVHFYETTDGLMLQKNPEGFYCYAEGSEKDGIAPGPLTAADPALRTPEEQTYLKGIDQKALRERIFKKTVSEKTRSQKVAPGVIPAEFPTTGEVRGLLVLAQYEDIKFSEAATAEAYDRVMNEENYSGTLAAGSVRDYFLAQSGYQLKLVFDVVGPVTLSNKRAFYGSAQTTGKERVDEMVMEAVKLAHEQNPELDFSRYDKNDDGVVDFIFVIYAGYGEAQGGGEECVWPQSSTLEYKDWTVYNGLYLGRYACSCELRNNKETNPDKALDGIGTFCHEFSHILGLPDIYDPKYSGCPGLNNWDVMDIGSYNDNSKTPAGYTAMDKYTVGWLTPEILETPRSLSLEALAVSNKAYFLVSETNPNEYFTFENRQKVGWDAALPGHGLLICHIEYDRTIWRNNWVNTNNYEHVSLVIADKNKNPLEGSDMRDVFPGSSNNTSFTDDTAPAMRWNSGEKVGRPVTNIREENGVIFFDFMKPAGIETNRAESPRVYSDGQFIIISDPTLNETAVYTTLGKPVYTGRNANCRIPVEKGFYLVRIGAETWKVNVR